MRSRTVLEPGLRAAILAAATACVLAAPATGAEPGKAAMVAIWHVDNESGAAEFRGSGFLIAATGYLVTARHVARHSEFVSLAVSIGGKNAPRSPVLRDERCSEIYDFCVLRILAADVVRARLAPDDFYRVTCRQIGPRETPRFYGFLGGDSHVSDVSGMTATDVIDEGLMLAGVPLEPAMSGGPVFDEKNEVVAIVKVGRVSEGLVLL